MRHKLLMVWYALLVILAIELTAFVVTGFLAEGYRKLLWDGFNNGISEYHNVEAGIPYADIINRCARSEKISAQVVAAVIQAESSFQPRAISSTGAQGLMQVIPSTWRQVNSQIKACVGRHTGECTSDCYFNPELNIAIGTAYLSQLYRTYDGDMVKALAAYNAGPGEVSRYNGVPPYKETNDYIERIITYWYKMQSKPLPLCTVKAEFWKDIRSTLGVLCAMTVFLIVVTMWRLLRKYRSWHWR